MSASIKVTAVLVVFFFNGTGSMAPADLWFCNANGSVWRPWVHGNLFKMRQKHVPHHLFLHSVSNDSAPQPRVGFDMQKPQRENEWVWERVHFLVITLGDVMGSQPVPLEYTQLCDTLISHGCDKTSIHLCSQALVFLNKPVKMNCIRILIVTALPKNLFVFFGWWWWWWCNSSRLHTFSE